ncbi:MAG TPA: glycoside hydrolase family 95 protein, partial [Ohtaekwangia sp.]|uniref:glycoside hydrolase family 95 protein n=1 Tax=Ohtaekwangia sp. TaxID=2066019 RepID=UPI002F936322
MRQLMKYSIPVVLLFVTVVVHGQQKPLRLLYDKPAQRWEETLPLGNGRLGMMPDGGVEKETIVLNDITLWSGGAQDANNEQAYESLPAIRKLLLEGKNDEAQALVNQNFVCKGPGSGRGDGANVAFGCYQVLANLELSYSYKNIPSGNIPATSYKRELSLNNAVATSQYTVNDIHYTREYFTSFGDDIAMVRLTASRPGQITCKISLTRPERFVTVADKDGLRMTGQLNNGTDGKGMLYVARVKAQLKGGEQHV